jgi:hypothetical protein
MKIQKIRGGRGCFIQRVEINIIKTSYLLFRPPTGAFALCQPDCDPFSEGEVLDTRIGTGTRAGVSLPGISMVIFPGTD